MHRCAHAEKSADQSAGRARPACLWYPA
jgi:hypothetical protein